MGFYSQNTSDEEWLMSLPSYQRRRRRLLEAQKLGSHTREEWIAKRDSIGACVLCGATDRPLSKDHVVPLSGGGSDGIDNLQPLCGPCNSAKGAR